MSDSTFVSPTHNDFRSDTFTVPSPSIIQAASTCSLGDDDYYEDKDTLELGQYVADLAGKEAGLYCVSGVMTNQVGLRTLLHQPPYSILCDSRAHIYRYEGAGLSMLSSAMVYPVIPSNGIYMTLEDIKKHIVLSEDYYHPTTRVISLENTINGVVVPYDEIKRICEWGRSKGVKMHLDGARLWNASVATGVSVKQYCELFDTVSLCLSKGIGAPIGSVLVSTNEIIRIAKRFRKQVGGNLRQAGVITSMAMVALKQNFPSGLQYTHELAKDVEKFCIDKNVKLIYPVDTNFVWLDFGDDEDGILAAKFNLLGKKNGILLSGQRIGIHYQISRQSIEALKKTIAETFEK